MPLQVIGSKTYLLADLKSWLQDQGVDVHVPSGSRKSLLSRSGYEAPDLLSTSTNEFGDKVLCGYFAIPDCIAMRSRSEAIARLGKRARGMTLFVVSTDSTLVPETLPEGVNLLVRQYSGTFVHLIFENSPRLDLPLPSQWQAAMLAPALARNA